MDHKYFNFFSVLFSHLKYATPNLDKSSVRCREGVEERRGERNLQNLPLIWSLRLICGPFYQETITIYRCRFSTGLVNPEDCVGTTSCKGSEFSRGWDSSKQWRTLLDQSMSMLQLRFASWLSSTDHKVSTHYIIKIKYSRKTIK